MRVSCFALLTLSFGTLSVFLATHHCAGSVIGSLSFLSEGLTGAKDWDLSLVRISRSGPLVATLRSVAKARNLVQSLAIEHDWVFACSDIVI